MADLKISQLPIATTPLTGAELLPIVQSGVTDQTTVTNLTAGRAILGLAFIPGYTTTVTSGTTTTLLSTSTQIQRFSGVFVQIVTLPDSTTPVVISNGLQYLVINDSSNILTIQSATPTTIATLPAGSWGIFTHNGAQTWSIQTGSTSNTGIATNATSGYISTDAQTIAGQKTFTNGAIFGSSIGVTGNVTASGTVTGNTVTATTTITAPNIYSGYTTTATAAGTTTLTNASTQNQFFTGATTQTVVLPVTSTLALGFLYTIVNLSTGLVTVQSSGANTIRILEPNTMLNLSCTATTGTGIASWSYAHTSLAGGALDTNNQTGTAYSFTLLDMGGTVTANNAAASTYTLPQASTTVFPIGTRLKLTNLGTGAVTLVKEGSETLLGNPLLNQYATAIIERTSATQWQVFGGTAVVNMIGVSTLIQVVANATYNLNYFPGCAGTILGVAEKARALTTAGTFKIQINGVDVTSLTAVTPTIAGAYTAATGANTFTRGQAITITYSGTTAVLDHDVVIDWTQQF